MTKQDAPRGPIGFRLAHELEGILSGIGADGVINQAEATRLANWATANASFAGIRPFSELLAHIERALSDGVLTPEEVQDLLFVTGKYTTVNPYFDAMRGGIQTLMGLLAGVTADRVVNEYELAAMSDWIESWSHLRGLWPYDECNAIVTAIMATRRIGPNVGYLNALAVQFPVAGDDQAASVSLTLAGICAVDPQIDFRDRTFVFTGESPKAPRSQLATIVELLGGREEPSVTRRTHYLVVCDEGCELWAFSCYGRKVEKAYQMRRDGHGILIVSERDFWDALAGHGFTA